MKRPRHVEIWFNRKKGAVKKIIFSRKDRNELRKVNKKVRTYGFLPTDETSLRCNRHIYAQIITKKGVEKLVLQKIPILKMFHPFITNKMIKKLRAFENSQHLVKELRMKRVSSWGKNFATYEGLVERLNQFRPPKEKKGNLVFLSRELARKIYNDQVIKDLYYKDGLSVDAIAFYTKRPIKEIKRILGI